MKRLGRWVLNAATGLSLLLCLAVAAAWVRSYWRHEIVSRYSVTGQSFSGVSNLRGRLGVTVFHGHFSAETSKKGSAFRYSSEDPHDGMPLAFTFLGIGWQSGTDPFPGILYVAMAVVPFGYVFALFAALPAIRLYRRVRRKHPFSPGHCKHCGYDLRATPGRCPECGAEAVPPVARST